MDSYLYLMKGQDNNISIYFILLEVMCTLFTYTAQHPSSSMEIHEASSQAFTNRCGFVDSHRHLRKRQVLHSQTRRNRFQASQKPGREPSDVADLIANAQTMQDPALRGITEQPRVGDESKK